MEGKSDIPLNDLYILTCSGCFSYFNVNLLYFFNVFHPYITKVIVKESNTERDVLWTKFMLLSFSMTTPGVSSYSTHPGVVDVTLG